MPLRRSVKNGQKREECARAGSLKYMQFPEGISNENTKKEKCARYPDESKEKVERFLYDRYIHGSD